MRWVQSRLAPDAELSTCHAAWQGALNTAICFDSLTVVKTARDALQMHLQIERLALIVMCPAATTTSDLSPGFAKATLQVRA